MKKRDLYQLCLDHLSKDEITIITGARQVGKTTDDNSNCKRKKCRQVMPQ
ncbi:MAG: hypothetical protein IID16_09920 [Candidatus Marinimicrobia bacterium]|nr:hypothetical protein [Candidatus Neomarinimicrobiota bacterium]